MAASRKVLEDLCAFCRVGWKVASCTGDDFYERSDDGGLRRYVFHIEQRNRNASIQPRWRDLQCVAVGDHLRCDLGRGALLHNGRDNADYILCSMRSTDDCLQDRVSPGDRCRARKTASAVASAGYTIDLNAAATPSFSPAGGTYTSAQTVTIADTTTGANIYYCVTAGCTPTASSTLYTGPITVSRARLSAPWRLRPGMTIAA